MAPGVTLRCWQGVTCHIASHRVHICGQVSVVMFVTTRYDTIMQCGRSYDELEKLVAES